MWVSKNQMKSISDKIKELENKKEQLDNFLLWMEQLCRRKNWRYAGVYKLSGKNWEDYIGFAVISSNKAWDSERIHSYQVRGYLCSYHDADKPRYVAELEQQLSDNPKDIDNILEIGESYVKGAANIRKGIGSCGMDVIKGIAKELHCTLIYGDKVPQQDTEEAMAILTAFYAKNGFSQKEGSRRINYDMRQYQCHDASHLDEAPDGGPYGEPDDTEKLVLLASELIRRGEKDKLAEALKDESKILPAMKEVGIIPYDN